MDRAEIEPTTLDQNVRFRPIADILTRDPCSAKQTLGGDRRTLPVI